MIRVLDGNERAAARAAFSQVFTGTTHLRAPFQSTVEARMLLFPALIHALDAEQHRALFAAARALGDGEVYIGTYMFNWHERDDFQDWLAIDLADEDAYHRAWAVEGGWEHALLSPSGRWGALTTEGEEAYVGGPQAFVDAIRARLGDGREDAMVRNWLGYWEDMRRPDFEPEWIADLLEHLYGAERAHAWLARTSFAR